MIPDRSYPILLGRLSAVFMFLLAMCAHVEPEHPRFGEPFLPDAQFVLNQCKQLLSETMYRQTVRIREACTAYENDRIDGDTWLRRLSLVLRPTPRCPPFMLCSLRVVLPLVPIPKGFKSYSVALFPTIGDEPSEIEQIREAFFAFGDAIGEHHIAIWFDPGQTVAQHVHGRRAEAKVDVSRSKYYCDQFGLNYNDGPYIVTTERRPDTVSDADERIVVELGGISGNRVVRVLNVLEQDLRTEREVRTRTLLFEEVKQRLLSAVDRHGETLKNIAIEAIK